MNALFLRIWDLMVSTTVLIKSSFRGRSLRLVRVSSNRQFKHFSICCSCWLQRFVSFKMLASTFDFEFDSRVSRVLMMMTAWDSSSWRSSSLLCSCCWRSGVGRLSMEWSTSDLHLLNLESDNIYIVYLISNGRAFEVCKHVTRWTPTQWNRIIGL